MMKVFLLSLSFVLLTACGSTESKVAIKTATNETEVILADSSNYDSLIISYSDIHDFISELANQRLLDRTLELKNDAETYEGWSQLSDGFFEELISKETGVTADSTSVWVISSHSSPKISEEDYNFIKQQKQGIKNFSWDLQQLKFYPNNKKNWYYLSVPLFTKDRTKAFMVVHNYCPGLCGWTYVKFYEKKDNKWKEYNLSSAVH